MKVDQSLDDDELAGEQGVPTPMSASGERRSVERGTVERSEAGLQAETEFHDAVLGEDNLDLAPASNEGHGTPRRQFLLGLTAIGVGTAAFRRALAVQVAQRGKLTAEMIGQAEWIAGIELDEEEREDVARSIARNLASAEQLRSRKVDADEVPALVFRPDFFYASAHDHQGVVAGNPSGIQVGWSAQAARTMGDDELAFASVLEQAALLAAGNISSRELTGLYLKRLKKYDPLLKCVVTLLEEHALQQADASDERRSRGTKLGPLDGIPWVAKDLIALPPWKTTWGAEPFKEQVRPHVATVATRLEAAGAVLLAKVTLGALAWGDRWFGGTTRNPWYPEQGSSGSSAGSAAAVAAGLTGFAIGSETLGSIVSPCRRCRTSGLRPTFGRVSRAGCMPLSWSMDKIGPIARHIDDLAQVFAAIAGTDGRDPTLVERAFQWPVKSSASELRVGVTGDRLNATETKALAFLESEGATIVEIDLDSDLPVGAMSFVLGTEASTVFDDDFRADQKADYGNWPSTFRQSQFVPAIQYLRANRIRSELIVETERKLSSVDVVLGGDDLLLTNLTGHPSMIVACGADQIEVRSQLEDQSESDQETTDEADRPKRMEIAVPGVVKLTASAYREANLLHVGAILQRALPPRPSQPSLDDWTPGN